MAEEEIKKMEFPIQGADKCPHCGSTDKKVGAYFDELERTNKVPQGSLAGGAKFQIPIVQVLTGGLTVGRIPVISIYWEVCGKCFTFYVTKVDIDSQQVQVQGPQMNPGPRFRPPFGRG